MLVLTTSETTHELSPRRLRSTQVHHMPVLEHEVQAGAWRQGWAAVEVRDLPHTRPRVSTTSERAISSSDEKHMTSCHAYLPPTVAHTVEVELSFAGIRYVWANHEEYMSGHEADMELVVGIRHADILQDMVKRHLQGY